MPASRARSTVLVALLVGALLFMAMLVATSVRSPTSLPSAGLGSSTTPSIAPSTPAVSSRSTLLPPESSVDAPTIPPPESTDRPQESPIPPPVGITRYVSTDGSDLNDGSPSRPLRTIQAAVSASSAGDAVVVREGTYAPFVVSVAARRSAPFVVRAAPDEVVTIRGQSSLPSSIRITGSASWVTVAGFTVSGTTGYRSAGVLVESIRDGGSTTLRDLTVTNNAGFGIHVYESTDVTVQNNNVSNNGTGVQVTDYGEGVLIRDNDIHENDRMMRDTPTPTNDDYGADAVAFDGTTGHVVVTDNRIWGNRAPSHDYTWDGGAFSIFGASNLLIGWNTIWDNENVLETGTDGHPCANDQFVRNVAWGAATEGRSWGIFLRCGQDMLIAHNTLVDLDSFALSVDDDDSTFASSITGARILNNIFAMRNGGKVFGFPSFDSLPPDLTIDYDLVWVPGGVTATVAPGFPLPGLSLVTQLSGFEAHGIEADPRFATDAVGDYRLGADSPAIDRAIPLPALESSVSGVGPDIGRWEYTPGT
jgi:parallel beta-helix repeat protein